MPGLLPEDANARARAITWMFAALNTMEPPILDLADRQARWSATSPGTSSACRCVEERIRDRLGQLSGRLGDADWLDGAFSAGDLMMVAVLVRLKSIGHAGRISEPRRLCRPGEARPAFKRAFAAQLAVFTGG